MFRISATSASWRKRGPEPGSSHVDEYACGCLRLLTLVHSAGSRPLRQTPVDGAAGAGAAVRQDGRAPRPDQPDVLAARARRPSDLRGSPAVSDLPAPSASRLSRARWLDARLLVGLLLVLLSVVVGAKVVADADQRVQVWSVTRDLGADTPLTGDDLAGHLGQPVRLDQPLSRRPSQDLEGLVLTRPVGRGELLPVSAVAHGDSGQKRRDRHRGRPVRRRRPATRAAWSTSTSCRESQQRRVAAAPGARAVRGDRRRGREVRRQRLRRQRVQGGRRRCWSTGATCPTSSTRWPTATSTSPRCPAGAATRRRSSSP